MRLSALFLSVLLLTSCGLSLDELHELVEESRACEPGEQCVLAGAGQCTCETPVNAKHRQRIDEAAAEVRCGGAMVECPTIGSVACEAGRCVG
ncbi:MAG: hypothetical protein ACOX6T_22160, partial [Myxococcales bacterium]